MSTETIIFHRSGHTTVCSNCLDGFLEQQRGFMGDDSLGLSEVWSELVQGGAYTIDSSDPEELAGAVCDRCGEGKPSIGTAVKNQGSESLLGFVVGYPEDRPDWNGQNFVTVEWEDARVTNELASDITVVREA